jgi:hypothetical protein
MGQALLRLCGCRLQLNRRPKNGLNMHLGGVIASNQGAVLISNMSGITGYVNTNETDADSYYQNARRISHTSLSRGF